jgi:hypothetical protein
MVDHAAATPRKSQGSLVAAGFISGHQSAVEEVLLFGVLVLVKHRLPSIFDRFVRSV